MRRGTIVGRLGWLTAALVVVAGLGVVSLMSDRGGTALASPALAAAPQPAVATPEPAAAAAPVSSAPVSPEPAFRRVSFTWTGNGSDDNWSTAGNWSAASAGYPDDCNDDAIIDSGSWDIAVVTVQMDDLTISGSVDFSASAGVPQLKADSIGLVGSSELTLTFSGCVVKTFGCP